MTITLLSSLTSVSPRGFPPAWCLVPPVSLARSGRGGMAGGSMSRGGIPLSGGGCGTWSLTALWTPWGLIPVTRQGWSHLQGEERST